MFEPKIFKAYDIRGIYGKEFDDDLAYKLGRAVVVHFGAKKIAVGRDVRASSPALYTELSRGITEQGSDVIDLGVVTTPMVHFAAGRLDIDLAIAVTASHNPPEYNGFKIDLKEAIPVGEKTGLLGRFFRFRPSDYSESRQRRRSSASSFSSCAL